MILQCLLQVLVLHPGLGKSFCGETLKEPIWGNIKRTSLLKLIKSPLKNITPLPLQVLQ